MLARALLVGLGLLIALTACVQPRPERLEFGSSPRIFRGTYEGGMDTRSVSRSIAFSSDGSLLAMSNQGGAAVQLWSVDEGKPTKHLGRQEPFFEDIALSADGSVVAAIIGREIWIWEVASETRLRVIPAQNIGCWSCSGETLLAISPDGARLAFFTRTERGELDFVELHDLEAGSFLGFLPVPKGSNAALRVSPDSSRLALLSPAEGTSPTQLTLWDLRTAEKLGDYTLSPRGGRQLDPLYWAEGSPVVVTVYADRLELVVVTTERALQTITFDGFRGDVTSVRVSMDGSQIAVTLPCRDCPSEVYPAQETVIWDTETSRVLARARAVGRYGPEDLWGFSPDGRYFVSFEEDGNVVLRLRDAMTLEPTRDITNGEVVPVRIEVAPTYVDERNYTVEGTVRFADSDPVPFRGRVNGGDEHLYVQTSPYPNFPAYMEARFTDQGTQWRLSGGLYTQGGSSWYLSFDSDFVNGEWTKSYPPAEFSLVTP